MMEANSRIRGALARAAESVSRFAAVSSTGARQQAPDVEEIIDTYLATRRALASAMQEVALSQITEGYPLFQRLRRSIEERMRERYGDSIPPKYLTLRGYTGIHPVAFEYLAAYQGQPVRGSRLRVLTADQVHTERRVRELRDLGLAIHAERISGENQYTLQNAEPDLDLAAEYQLAKNLENDRKLSRADRVALAAIAQITID